MTCNDWEEFFVKPEVARSESDLGAVVTSADRVEEMGPSATSSKRKQPQAEEPAKRSKNINASKGPNVGTSDAEIETGRLKLMRFCKDPNCWEDLENNGAEYKELVAIIRSIHHEGKEKLEEFQKALPLGTIDRDDLGEIRRCGFEILAILVSADVCPEKLSQMRKSLLRRAILKSDAWKAAHPEEPLTDAANTRKSDRTTRKAGCSTAGTSLATVARPADRSKQGTGTNAGKEKVVKEAPAKAMYQKRQEEVPPTEVEVQQVFEFLQDPSQWHSLKRSSVEYKVFVKSLLFLRKKKPEQLAHLRESVCGKLSEQGVRSQSVSTLKVLIHVLSKRRAPKFSDDKSHPQGREALIQKCMELVRTVSSQEKPEQAAASNAAAAGAAGEGPPSSPAGAPGTPANAVPGRCGSRPAPPTEPVALPAPAAGAASGQALSGSAGDTAVQGGREQGGSNEKVATPASHWEARSGQAVPGLARDNAVLNGDEQVVGSNENVRMPAVQPEARPAQAVPAPTGDNLVAKSNEQKAASFPIILNDTKPGHVRGKGSVELLDEELQRLEKAATVAADRIAAKAVATEKRASATRLAIQEDLARAIQDAKRRAAEAEARVDSSVSMWEEERARREKKLADSKLLCSEAYRHYMELTKGLRHVAIEARKDALIAATKAWDDYQMYLMEIQSMVP